MPLHRNIDHISSVKDRAAAVLAGVIALAYCFIYRDLFVGERTFSHDSIAWFGTFHYYIENIKNGIFPYWDPYSLTGTFFYPNISGYGLLDPTVLLCALVSKISDVSSLTLFIYFRLFRMFLFVGGAFFLFRDISKNSTAAVLSAGILLFTVTIQNSHQPMMDLSFSIPIALFLILRIFDAVETRERCLYMFGLALVTGVTMNIYIPALYLLNIVFFVVLLFITKRYELRRVVRTFSEAKMLWCGGACLALALMMASPPLVVSLLDTTKDGEVFAIAKLVDSNDGNFKEMMASDFGGDLFFDKLRKHSAAFISYGSILNLISPDVTGFRDRLFLLAPGGHLYMGIIPIVLMIVGLAYTRPRLKHVGLGMAGLVFFATFSFSGINGEYNVLQKAMNALFPPLRMLDMRMNFSSALSFYLCMTFCLAVSALLKNDLLSRLVRIRFRSLVLFMLTPVLIKAMINLALQGRVFLSGYDTAIMLMPAVMIAGITAMRYKILSYTHMVAAILLLIILDLSYAGIRAADTMAYSKSVADFLNEKERYRRFSIGESLRSYRGFEYFRLPYVPAAIAPIQTFIETMVQTKSAIISNSLISIFTTKRYYDLFSLMPLEQQLAVTGVMHPVVRFFPLDQVMWKKNSREVFDVMRRSDAETLGGRLLLEQEASPRQELDFNEMKDVPWFGTSQVADLYRSNVPYMKNIRMNLAQFLNTEDYQVQVDRFSINDIEISVENVVGGYLLYNDGWSRYWKAHDRDQELPVVAANYNSKAVFLPPGKHLVRFVFSPTCYQLSIKCFYAALVLCCIALAALWKREKQPNGGGRQERG